MQIPRTVYVLSANSRTMGVSCKYGSYIVGFPVRKHAMHVQTFAHERTPLTLMEKLRGGLRPIPVDMDQDGDVETSPGVCIGHNIVIAKTQRPDGVMPCMLRQLDLVDVMTFPIAKGIGVIFALDIEREEDHEVVFDTTIFHPNETSTVIFRKHMLKMNE